MATFKPLERLQKLASTLATFQSCRDKKIWFWGWKLLKTPKVKLCPSLPASIPIPQPCLVRPTMWHLGTLDSWRVETPSHPKGPHFGVPWKRGAIGPTNEAVHLEEHLGTFYIYIYIYHFLSTLPQEADLSTNVFVSCAISFFPGWPKGWSKISDQIHSFILRVFRLRSLPQKRKMPPKLIQIFISLGGQNVVKFKTYLKPQQKTEAGERKNKKINKKETPINLQRFFFNKKYNRPNFVGGNQEKKRKLFCFLGQICVEPTFVCHRNSCGLKCPKHRWRVFRGSGPAIFRWVSTNTAERQNPTDTTTGNVIN